MKILILVLIYFSIIHPFIFRKYKNPYKLYMIFGKKGSGKSSYLVKLAIKYRKKGYNVYTNMLDCTIPDVRIIDADDLGEFVPEQKSVVLLDECGILFDNRNYKNFKPAVRDFFKLQRHYKCVVYLASQTFDIDKKLRDLTDEMILVQNIGTVYSLLRPISKKITLTEATAEGESRIAENLKFRFITSWRLFYIPKFSRYFASFVAPERPLLDYQCPDSTFSNAAKRPKWKLKKTERPSCSGASEKLNYK